MCVCMCSIVRRLYLLLSLFTDDVGVMRKVTTNGQTEREKMGRVEQQEREREKKICSAPRKRESENEEIAKRISTLNSEIHRERKRG